jgi:wobble nucleotide-excising tRNase
MIEKISIHNYKSYHPTTPLAIEFDTQKPATFIYGLNGAGKSAIGDVIHGRHTADPAFAHCRVQTTGTGPFRHLVYNQAFVSRVIGETMQGIFTIGELDTEKQREIDATTAENVALETELTTLREREKTAKTRVNEQIARGIDEVWKAHGTGKSTKLESLLQGYGRDKKKFFEDLRTYSVKEDAVLDTMARLEQRWADLSGASTTKSAPEIDLSGLAEIEADEIWAEPIEVSSASRLAALIAKLGNGDWVGQGQAYMMDDQCPFCQQKLPHDFHNELSNLLEGGRKLKIEKIDNLITGYSRSLALIQERMTGVCEDSIAKDTNLDFSWAKVKSAMRANLAVMRAKQAKPADPVSIEGADYAAMAAALSTLNEKIADFNLRFLDRGSERAKIRTMFYQVLCADRGDAYAAHDAALAPLNAEHETEFGNVARVEGKIASNNARLAELRRSQTGVDASVEAINTRLKDLGITSFWIRSTGGDGHLYCLARPNIADCSAVSLSEGEKTLISFLYFMELIKGTHEETGTVDITKTIVVIDDPISSLSHNFIYDVATIIHNQLIKPSNGTPKVRQVIVLTHNLFFFHEMVRQLSGRNLESASKKCQMLRVHKNEFSNVSPLDPTTYMNDYDALWHVLRDARDNKAAAQVVPNTMRCILEQFFAFTTGIDDFDCALEKMAVTDSSHQFKALHRYLDRGSHKDGINGPPIDWSQYDVNYYLGKLRALLSESGHEEHYLRKMGEEANKQIAA